MSIHSLNEERDNSQVQVPKGVEKVENAGLEHSFTSSLRLSYTNFASKILPCASLRSGRLSLCLRFNKREKKRKQSPYGLCSACRENLDTLAEVEKGRYIFRSYIRSRTGVRQSVRTEKARNPKAISMSALGFIIYCNF